jgi:uncharacterized membrane protein YcaP (DUF421 family)
LRVSPQPLARNKRGMWFNSWAAVDHSAIIAATGFVALVIIVRVSGNRTLSRMNAFDFIVTVSIGSILGRSIVSPSVSLAQTVVGVGVLVILQTIVALIGARSHRFYTLATPTPKTLFADGDYQLDVMRRNGVGIEELQAAVRETGLHDVAEADRIVLETQGQLSVVWRPRVERTRVTPRRSAARADGRSGLAASNGRPAEDESG